MYKSKFEEYLNTTLSAQSLTKLYQALAQRFSSPHRRTKVINNPAIATHSELLHLEELLGVDAYLLYQQRGVGADGLTVIEKRNLKERYEIKRKQAAA